MSSSPLKQLYQAKHPLILHKLSYLRQETTHRKVFRELVGEITLLLVYEVTKDLKLRKQEIQTPLETFQAPRLKLTKNPVILPILRAGIGMVDAFLSLLPNAKVGHMGIFRDESSLYPKEYYFKIPEDSHLRTFYVCDPMLATGGSACFTISKLKNQGIIDIKLVCLVAAPEGVREINRQHPDIPIYCAALDRQLNQSGYILPGLGDAGDRLFGTK